MNSFKEGVYHTSSHLLLRIISYTLNILNFLLGYEFHLRFSGENGSYETSYLLTLNTSVLFCLASPTFKMQ